MLRNFLEQEYGISRSIYEAAVAAESELTVQFAEIDGIRDYNQMKVLKALQNQGIAERHFAGTSGYGYDDAGRDALDAVYAETFGTEDALVRSQIISGTQALAVCLYGILRPGDELIAVTGKPYDTLEEVIGIREKKRGALSSGSLKDFGIRYRQIDLKYTGDEPGGDCYEPDYEAIRETVTARTKMVMLQRSRGYSFRKALTIPVLQRIIKIVKQINPEIIVMVDNCYGEFVEQMEPTQVGADLIAGSLIKNPGGGLALSGGYIAGKQEFVEVCAQRLTAPGLGKHVGASLNSNRSMIQGFYFAPHVVAESLKGAVFAARFFEKMGFQTSPSSTEPRGDIIQAIQFHDPLRLKQFCQAVQAAAPVDAFVVPEPWDMPGYEAPVIMAAGAFVQGASIELSADGPMVPPYTAYMQGGLIFSNVKLAVMLAAQRLKGVSDV